MVEFYTVQLTFLKTYPFDSVKTAYQRKCLERNTVVKYPKIQWFDRKSYRGELSDPVGIQNYVLTHGFRLQALALLWHALALRISSFSLLLNLSRRRSTSYRIRRRAVQRTESTLTSLVYILIDLLRISTHGHSVWHHFGRDSAGWLHYFQGVSKGMIPQSQKGRFVNLIANTLQASFPYIGR